MTNFYGSWWVLGSLLAGSEVNPRPNPQKQKTVKSLAITNKSVNFAASYGQITPATGLKLWVYTSIEATGNSAT